MPHADTVRGIYDAFARGDVAAILEPLADDVEWEYGVNSTTVPWLQPRRGRDAVPAFFEALFGAVELHRFEAKELLEGRDLVVAIIDIEFTVRATGRRVVEEDEAHVWRFADGKVVRFRHRADTHQQQLAWNGVDQ
jgi:ketosteroid isomerase-like protein